MRRVLFSLQYFGLVVFCLSQTSQATPIYRYSAEQAVYAIQTGERVEIRVFLEESLSPSDSSLLLTEGLIGAGVRVDFNLVPLPSEPAQVLSLDDIAPNSSEFDDVDGLDKDLQMGVSAGFVESVSLITPPVVGVPITADTNRIYLGSFWFTAGNIPGETTFISFNDRSTADETVTGVSGVALDSLIEPGTAAISTLAAVPEPSTLFMLSLGLLLTIRWRWRVATRLPH